MTCSSCEEKVKTALSNFENITDVVVSKKDKSAIINMKNRIAIADLQNALGHEKYKISENFASDTLEPAKSWLETYKPIILILGYIFGITLLTQINNARFDAMQMMQQFMAGFFIAFSFFKLLNLSAFASSYAMYDVVAKRFTLWGFIYPFVELALGISFLISFQPLATNLITLIVMLVSSIGVLQSVLNKKKIQCACLGAVFNLPMSAVTVIENSIMILMSGIMILNLI